MTSLPLDTEPAVPACMYRTLCSICCYDDVPDCLEPAAGVVSGLRLCVEHSKSGPGQVIVTSGDAKYFGEIVPIKCEEEPWHEYKLHDGTGRVLRVKHVVKRVVRLIGLKTDDGVDTYTFQSDLVSDVQPAPSTAQGQVQERWLKSAGRLREP